ncbi:ParB domain nuclease [Desulfosarcina variabilis str. Montpellier]|uniref:ParB/RepB/Spo0J family partition protein n=1 Tax=Desulfosarcina variabilis TaxID=2300 RepID=UPI003AFAE132
MDYNVRHIRLSKINTSDQTFRITTNSDYSDLTPSISQMGVLQPPMLVPKGEGFIVVSGFRRISVCQSLSLVDIPARIINDHASGFDQAQMAIADNAFQRPLNTVEQSRALALIQRFAPDETDWHAAARLVGLPTSRKAVQRLLPIADMPESLQMAIVNGSIALPVAISIRTLHQDDGTALSLLFQKINTGLNNQRELFELIVETAIIKEMSVSRLLEQQDITSIFADDNTPMPQQVQRLRQVLKLMRYPELSKAEDAFHQAFKGLKVDPAIQLQPPRFFEGQTFRLSLSVRSRQQLKRLLADLEKIAGATQILPE